MFLRLIYLIAVACYSWGVQADPLDDFITHLTPTDPTPFALKPIAKLQEAAIAAMSFVGKPYVFGSSNPDVGFDCSGLVQYVLLQSGVKKLPRSSLEMYENSSPIEVDNLAICCFFAPATAKSIMSEFMLVKGGLFTRHHRETLSV